MGLDIRKPVGLMLALIGAQLGAYGLYDGPAPSGGNINVEWGAVLLIGGLGFLWFARRAGAR